MSELSKLVAYLRRHGEQGNALQPIVFVAASEILKAAEAIQRLMDGLRPFAEHPDFHTSDDWPVTFTDAKTREPGVTAGDFRKARSLLESVKCDTIP